jgi:hypothetical protein
VAWSEPLQLCLEHNWFHNSIPLKSLVPADMFQQIHQILIMLAIKAIKSADRQQVISLLVGKASFLFLPVFL